MGYHSKVKEIHMIPQDSKGLRLVKYLIPVVLFIYICNSQ